MNRILEWPYFMFAMVWCCCQVAEPKGTNKSHYLSWHTGGWVMLKAPQNQQLAVSTNRGYPVNGWFIRENPIYKWMSWEYPWFQETSIWKNAHRKTRVVRRYGSTRVTVCCCLTHVLQIAVDENVSISKNVFHGSVTHSCSTRLRVQNDPIWGPVWF